MEEERAHKHFKVFYYEANRKLTRNSSNSRTNLINKY